MNKRQRIAMWIVVAALIGTELIYYPRFNGRPLWRYMDVFSSSHPLGYYKIILLGILVIGGFAFYISRNKKEK